MDHVIVTCETCNVELGDAPYATAVDHETAGLAANLSSSHLLAFPDHSVRLDRMPAEAYAEIVRERQAAAVARALADAEDLRARREEAAERRRRETAPTAHDALRRAIGRGVLNTTTGAPTSG